MELMASICEIRQSHLNVLRELQNLVADKNQKSFQVVVCRDQPQTVTSTCDSLVSNDVKQFSSNSCEFLESIEGDDFAGPFNDFER